MEFRSKGEKEEEHAPQKKSKPKTETAPNFCHSFSSGLKTGM
jgi:hypothetical protein